MWALTIETRYLPSWVKDLSYVEVLQGKSIIFTCPEIFVQCCEATGASGCIFCEIFQKFWASQNWINNFSFISSETPDGHWNLQNCHHCLQHHWKLITRHFWTSSNERKPLSKQTCILRKCCGVSQKWWMLELSNLCHCVQHPSKLTSRDFWSSRIERKPLSQQKFILRKCCRISQKWWMVELSNLCHWVQHPSKLTSRDYWSSMHKRKTLSKLKHVLKKMLWSISEMVNARAFKPLPLCSAPLKTY